MKFMVIAGKHLVLEEPSANVHAFGPFETKATAELYVKHLSKVWDTHDWPLTIVEITDPYIFLHNRKVAARFKAACFEEDDIDSSYMDSDDTYPNP